MTTFTSFDKPTLRDAMAATRRATIGARLLRRASFVRWGVRVDTAPAWCWLALLAATLWPTWWWMTRRVMDRSDDPFGLLALAALAVVAWQQRLQLRAAPRLGWLAAALIGVVASTVAQGVLPALLVALVALLSLAAGLAAFFPSTVATAPVIGLSVLSLPLLASLQFYAGYPLRVVTAEVSRWLLALGHDAQRSGASLLVDGQLVIVDAPCSGVQMAWLGYFTACVVALYFGRSNRAFLTRLPLVGVLVLTGNIVRNTVLVAAEASGHHLPNWLHEGVGLVALACVCGLVAWRMSSRENRVIAAAGVRHV